MEVTLNGITGEEGRDMTVSPPAIFTLDKSASDGQRC